MKLKTYIENLQTFLKENPDAAEFIVVTSKDDEGNGFNPVYCPPSLGNWDEDEREFNDHGEDEEENYGEKNAVCVN